MKKEKVVFSGKICSDARLLHNGDSL